MKNALSKSDQRARARKFEGPRPAETPLPSTNAVALQWLAGSRREVQTAIREWFQAILSTGLQDPAAVVKEVKALIQQKHALARPDEPHKRRLYDEALLQMANRQGAEAFARHLLDAEETP